MNRNRQLAFAFAILLVSGTAIAAEDGWTLRFNGYWFEPDGSFSQTTTDGTQLRTDVDAGAAGGFFAERRFSRRLGLELGFIAGAESDLALRFDGRTNSFVGGETLSFVVLCVGPNIHLTPESRVDLFAGPTLVHMAYRDIDFGVFASSQPMDAIQGSTRVGVDDDFALGANLGLNVPLGRGGWLFSASVRYLDTTLDSTPAGGITTSVNFDPLMMGLGFGYRFGA